MRCGDMQEQKELKEAEANGRQSKALAAAAIALAAIIIVGGIVGYVSWKSNNVQKTGSYICDQALFDRAMSALESRTPADLDSVVDEMVELPNFDKSANCLYIALFHSVSSVDTGVARSYYDKLTDLQTRTTQTYDTRLQPFVYSKEDLINLIQLLETGGPTMETQPEATE